VATSSIYGYIGEMLKKDGGLSSEQWGLLLTKKSPHQSVPKVKKTDREEDSLLQKGSRRDGVKRGTE